MLVRDDKLREEEVLERMPYYISSLIAHLEREVTILRGFLKGLPNGVKVLARSLSLNGAAIVLQRSSPTHF